MTTGSSMLVAVSAVNALFLDSKVPPFSPLLYYSTKIFATDFFFLYLIHLCWKFSEHLCFPDWTMTDILTLVH